VPAHYGSVAEELEAVRGAVAVAERWDARMIELAGSDLPSLADRLGVAGVDVGAAAPLQIDLAPDAALEVRWCRLTRDQARVLVDGASSAHAEEPDRALIDAFTASREPRAASRLHATDLSSGLTTLCVIGTGSVDLLARLVRLDLDPRVFTDRRLALTGALGVPLQVLRWDRQELPAYELTVGRDVAEYFAEALTHAGEELGLRWLGAEAIDALPRRER
jgi:glycine cleavage system aminomethyltransferase T